MTYAARGFGLAATLVLVSILAVAPQAKAQSTSSTAANVYVQVGGPAGAVYGYSASSAGQLSAIAGSPFNPSGQIVGSTPTMFLTLGQTSLHSYQIGPSGAIGSQLGSASIYSYAGGECGDASDKSYQDIDSAVLDHSGKFIYVLLQNGAGNCAAFQSYAIGGTGNFTYLGDIDQTGINVEPVSTSLSLPSILGNETFAYDQEWSGHVVTVNGFQRESSGALQWQPFSQTGPGGTVPSGGWCPQSPDASPTGNYLVAQVGECDSGGNLYLASYTVDSKGNISTTNTSSNMPIAQGAETVFSPSGDLFAAWGGIGQGITLYHFNGAAPLTPYTTLLNGTTIRQVAWDSSNHLYAISSSEYATPDATNELYAFTVTPTSVTQDSSVSVAEPYNLVVTGPSAPSGGACSAPSTGGINVCSPGENATVASPVPINAAATISGGIYRFSLWNGNTRLLNEDSGVMNASLSLAAGSYDLVFDAENAAGVHESVTRNITVGTASCVAPSGNGVNVCSPAESSTVTSPVTINAAATVSGGVYRFSLWNGNTRLVNEDSGVMNQPLSLAPGSYKLTFDAESSAGVHAYATLNITVK